MTATIERPAAVLVGRFTVASPEWHEARAHGIGGSEIAAVLGLSRWESRFSLWHRKAGTVPPQEENPEMEAGKRLEPAILQKFLDDHPEFSAMIGGTYCHAERPWQIANPDLLLAPKCGCDLICECEEAAATALLEAKFALYDDDWGEPGTDEIPPYYLAQTRWYLDVFGLDTCYVEVFIGSSAEFRTYVVRADADDQAFLRDAAREFLDSLPGGPAEARPDIDAHSATYQAVRVLHPDIEPVDVELEPEVAIEFCTSREALADAEARARKAKSRVADAVGNGRRALYLGSAIATRQAKGNGVPYLVAARNLPRFTEEGTS